MKSNADNIAFSEATLRLVASQLAIAGWQFKFNVERSKYSGWPDAKIGVRFNLILPERCMISSDENGLAWGAALAQEFFGQGVQTWLGAESFNDLRLTDIEWNKIPALALSNMVREGCRLGWMPELSEVVR